RNRDADKRVMMAANLVEVAPQASTTSAEAEADRKMVRTATLEMLVQHPADTAEKIRVLAEREGGFLVSSEVRGQVDAGGESVTIRVPAGRFDSVRDEIRKLGVG